MRLCHAFLCLRLWAYFIGTFALNVPFIVRIHHFLCPFLTQIFKISQLVAKPRMRKDWKSKHENVKDWKSDNLQRPQMFENLVHSPILFLLCWKVNYCSSAQNDQQKGWDVRFPDQFFAQKSNRKKGWDDDCRSTCSRYQHYRDPRKDYDVDCCPAESQHKSKPPLQRFQRTTCWALRFCHLFIFVRIWLFS